jgi:hypothetical protein
MHRKERAEEDKCCKRGFQRIRLIVQDYLKVTHVRHYYIGNFESQCTRMYGEENKAGKKERSDR